MVNRYYFEGVLGSCCCLSGFFPTAALPFPPQRFSLMSHQKKSNVQWKYIRKAGSGVRSQGCGKGTLREGEGSLPWSRSAAPHGARALSCVFWEKSRVGGLSSCISQPQPQECPDCPWPEHRIASDAFCSKGQSAEKQMSQNRKTGTCAWCHLHRFVLMKSW